MAQDIKLFCELFKFRFELTCTKDGYAPSFVYDGGEYPEVAHLKESQFGCDIGPATLLPRPTPEKALSNLIKACKDKSFITPGGEDINAVLNDKDEYTIDWPNNDKLISGFSLFCKMNDVKWVFRYSPLLRQYVAEIPNIVCGEDTAFYNRTIDGAITNLIDAFVEDDLPVKYIGKQPLKLPSVDMLTNYGQIIADKAAKLNRSKITKPEGIDTDVDFQ